MSVTREGSGLWSDHGDGQSESPRGGGDLRSEHPLAEDDEPGRAGQFGSQRERVVERAEHVHAGKTSPHGQPAWGDAGGDHDRIGAQ